MWILTSALLLKCITLKKLLYISEKWYVNSVGLIFVEFMVAYILVYTFDSFHFSFTKILLNIYYIFHPSIRYCLNVGQHKHSPLNIFWSSQEMKSY